MNHIYRLVWSAVRQRLIVAPESARGGQGGSSQPSRAKPLCVALLAAFAEVVGALGALEERWIELGAAIEDRA